MMMGRGANNSPAFLLTNDEQAYETVKAAKSAVLNGNPKPDDCPQEIWLMLQEKYEARH